MTAWLDVEKWQEAAWSMLQELTDAASVFLPKLAGAVLLILLGWAVSRLVQLVARFAFRRVGLDRLADRLKLNDSLQGVLQGKPVSHALSLLLFWVLFLFFFLLAADVLELRAVTATTDRLLAFLPQLLGAVIIIGFGVIVGRLIQRVVESGAALGRLDVAPRVAAAANLAVVFTASVIAIDQLGVSTQILVSVVTVLAASLGLAMGAAFALGARPVIGHILAGHFLRRRLTVGDEVEFDGLRGVVDRVGPTDTLFRDGEAFVSVPNSTLLERTVKW
ncbi:MAG: hypothetical protein ACFB9M_20245 [Myxococcota bacterium]